MKPHVFTSTTLASSAEVRFQPEAVRRAASSSESTSLRAQPSVTRLTDRGVCGPDALGRGDPDGEDTPRAYAVSRAGCAGPVRLAGLGAGVGMSAGGGAGGAG